MSTSGEAGGPLRFPLWPALLVIGSVLACMSLGLALSRTAGTPFRAFATLLCLVACGLVVGGRARVQRAHTVGEPTGARVVAAADRTWLEQGRREWSGVTSLPTAIGRLAFGPVAGALQLGPAVAAVGARPLQLARPLGALQDFRAGPLVAVHPVRRRGPALPLRPGQGVCLQRGAQAPTYVWTREVGPVLAALAAAGFAVSDVERWPSRPSA